MIKLRIVDARYAPRIVDVGFERETVGLVVVVGRGLGASCGADGGRVKTRITAFRPRRRPEMRRNDVF